MPQEDDPQIQTMISNMPAKTGRSLDEWFKLLADSGLVKHGQMMRLLKGEYGVTHGFANMIALLYRQHAEGGEPTQEDLVVAQYDGAKSAMRPVYEQVLKVIQALGDDVEIAPKKTYVSLRRSKQFAIIQVSTKNRIDLGLNLKGAEDTQRLEGGNVFGGMCTHRIRLSEPDEVDDEVAAWLRAAYEQA